MIHPENSALLSKQMIWDIKTQIKKPQEFEAFL
jgi:hypothetical protein